MTNACDSYRKQIPELFLGELGQESRPNLEQHLRECTACADEHALYAGTFTQLRTLREVPAPRHFFVQPDERRLSPFALLGQMSPAWKLSLAAAVLVLVAFSAVAAARLRVRVDNGTLVLAFGELPAPAVTPAAAPAVDTSALQSAIVRVLDEKNRNENLELVRALRAEISRANRSVSDRQRLLLETALSGMEARMSNRIVQTAKALEDNTNQSLTRLYETVSADRERDSAALNSRINRVAVNSEVKSGQTDAILETLLQVADSRMK